MAKPPAPNIHRLAKLSPELQQLSAYSWKLPRKLEPVSARGSANEPL